MSYEKILIVVSSAKYFEQSVDKRKSGVYNFENILQKGGGSLKGLPPLQEGQVNLDTQYRKI